MSDLDSSSDMEGLPKFTASLAHAAIYGEVNKEFLGHGNNEAAIPRGSEATLKQEGWHELIYAEKNLQRSRVHCEDALKYGIKEFGDVEHEHFEESLAWMATLADVGAAVLGGKEGVHTMH